MNQFPPRRSLFLMVCILLAFLTVGVPLSHGQATSSGTVIGVVTDQQGAVIPDTTVMLTDVSTKIARTTKSNNDGQYVLVNVDPGTYTITAVHEGFSAAKIASQPVSVGTQTTANFKLAIGTTETTIEVQASNADLQTMNASTGQTVDAALVDSLPAIGRDVSTFLTMQPGVTPGGNVGGTTADQATFQLDGGSNSSDMDGTQSGYTTSFAGSTTGGFIAAGPAGVMPMPQDSIEEFKVSTSGQTTDFNNSSGSQSQIVTKRGHDQVHGTVYEYYLDSSSTFTNYENCIFISKYTGGSHTNRGVTGSGGIGTNTKGTGGAAVNMFLDPAGVYGSVRPPILGLDARDGGNGPISGLGYLNLDLSVKKRLVLYERFSLEFSGIFYNFMNHLDFANPSLSLQSTSNWGVTKTQGNQPRQIQMGLRASF